MREHAPVAATELQRKRVFGGIEVEVMRKVAMHERRTRDHFRVKTRAPADEAQEVPAVPVRPIHHRGNA